MADEMLFCRSWFLLTESSSSEENDGRVSRFLLSSSSSLLQGEGQLLRPRLSSPRSLQRGEVEEEVIVGIMDECLPLLKRNLWKCTHPQVELQCPAASSQFSRNPERKL